MRVWQDAVSLHKDIISKLTSLPKEELYAMNSQLRRASLSISNNIAEGCGRDSNKELRNFLNIAMGSCKEVESMIIVARELRYITEETFTILIQKIIVIGKKLNSLMQKISISINQAVQVGQSPKNQQPTTKNQQREA